MKNVSPSLWTRLVDVAGLVATPLVPSHYIALVSPLAATHVRRARIERVEAETADTATLTLRPSRGWRTHRAGQHVRVGIELDGRIATRTYSISSAPDRGDGRITVTVKAQGRGSRALTRDAPVGSYVALGLPEGDFVLPEPPRAPIAFITGGSGITPVMSMLRALACRDQLADVVHVHHARHAGDVIFGDELRELAATRPGYRLVLVLTGADRRRWSRERLDDLVPDWRARETWASGPQGLLDSVIACFADRPGALHVERFAAPLAAVSDGAGGGTVRFAAARCERRTDGRTPLLRVAEDAGVAAPHGCRMGICHTCDATLLAGRVRDLRTGEHIDQAGTRIQVCVCAAAGDVELAL